MHSHSSLCSLSGFWCSWCWTIRGVHIQGFWYLAHCEDVYPTAAHLGRGSTLDTHAYVRMHTHSHTILFFTFVFPATKCHSPLWPWFNGVHPIANPVARQLSHVTRLVSLGASQEQSVAQGLSYSYCRIISNLCRLFKNTCRFPLQSVVSTPLSCTWVCTYIHRTSANSHTCHSSVRTHTVLCVGRQLCAWLGSGWNS